MEKQEKTKENRIMVELEDLHVRNVYNSEEDFNPNTFRVVCPNCYSTNLMVNGRCVTCYECGASTCSL